MKLNKLMAFTMAAAMVVTGPAAAFAASTTGNISVEVEDASGANFYRVELTASPANTAYSFSLDPNGLISKYDSSVAKGTVYFDGVEKTKSTLVQTDASTYDGKVYARTIKSGGSATGYMIADDDNAGKLKFDATKYPTGTNFYVWIPGTTGADGTYGILSDGTTPGEIGQTEIVGGVAYAYVDLNLYFTGTFADSTLSKVAANSDNLRYAYDKNDSNKRTQAVFDGKVYTDSYVALSAKDTLSTYGNDSGTAFTPKKNTLYICSKNSPKVYTALANSAISTTADETSKVKYVAGTTGYGNTSNTYTVVNKSTYDLNVSAKFTIDGMAYLPLASSAKLEEKDVSYGAYLALTDGKNASYAKMWDEEGSEFNASSDGDPITVIEADYLINAVDSSKTYTYQDKAADATKVYGHTYKKYFQNGVDYNSTTLYLTGAANPKYEGWSKWAAATGNKPTISVVYTIRPLSLDITDDTTLTGVVPGTYTEAPTIASATVNGKKVEIGTSAGQVSIAVDEGVATLTYVGTEKDMNADGEAIDDSVTYTIAVTIGKTTYTFLYDKTCVGSTNFKGFETNNGTAAVRS